MIPDLLSKTNDTLTNSKDMYVECYDLAEIHVDNSGQAKGCMHDCVYSGRSAACICPFSFHSI